MAALDELLARVPDPALRADLEREIAPLRGDQSLGLVFERHLPERVRLYGHPVRRGSVVEELNDGAPNIWQVVSAREGMATVRRRDGKSSVVEEEKYVDDLVVVRQFGESIYPGLRPAGEVTRGDDKPFHAVINAENYHALETLLYTCEGQVDAIFIDPPYNTGGARDWKYNNNYVDVTDEYRHSKWLAMMERRLQLAKRLMNPAQSVLIVSVDENEVHRLALLLERIFSASKVQMVTALINPAGASIIDQFSRVDEHLLFVHVGAARPSRTTTDTTPGAEESVAATGNAGGLGEDSLEAGAKPRKFQWEPFQRSGGNARREDTKEKFFPVYIDEEQACIVGCGDSLALGVDRSTVDDAPTTTVQQWPIKEDGSEACWQLKPETFRLYLTDGRVRLGRRNARTGRWGISFLTKGHLRAIDEGELVVTGRDRQGSLVVEHAAGRLQSRVGKTMWTHGSYSATEHGSTLLRNFIPKRRFPYPKSLYLVEDALRYYVAGNPNALILDFFAGSGTTAHATMRLNREDGGSRRSILVTNNEISEKEAETLRARGFGPRDDTWKKMGIFEFITKPRITAAVSGSDVNDESIKGDYRFTHPFPMSDGFEENVAFFELTYEDKDIVRLGAAFEAIAPLLWLKAGGQGPRIDAVTNPWVLPAEGRYGVLFEADEWPGFVDAIRVATGATHAFVVTDSQAVFQRVASELPPEVEPVRLYESYLTSFEVNTGARS